MLIMLPITKSTFYLPFKHMYLTAHFYNFILSCLWETKTSSYFFQWNV